MEVANNQDEEKRRQATWNEYQARGPGVAICVEYPPPVAWIRERESLVAQMQKRT